jgi:hypothetical protein
MSLAVLFGLAAAVLLAYPQDARAEEPTANDEQISCDQFQSKFPTPGKTKVVFSTTDPTESWVDKQQVNKNWVCVKLNADGLKNYKVTATINSSFHKWVVIDSEKSCQSVAKRVNDAIKGFEQEHINDVKPILEEFNKKLNEDVKPKDYCGDKFNDAMTSLKTAGNAVAEKADTKYTGQARDLDLGGKHTVSYNCSCAK